MRRVKLAFCILMVLIVVSTSGHVAVSQITRNITAQIEHVRAMACAENYAQAYTDTQSLLAYYEQNRCWLELMLKRENVATLFVSLSGLPAYSNEETVHDFISEADKALCQVSTMHHLFFSVF